MLSGRPLHVDASTARAALARDRLIRLAVALVLACAAPESRAGILAALAEGLGASVGPAAVSTGGANASLTRASIVGSAGDRMLSEREIALGGALALVPGQDIPLDRPSLTRAGAAPSTEVVPLRTRPRGPARNRDP